LGEFNESNRTRIHISLCCLNQIYAVNIEGNEFVCDAAEQCILAANVLQNVRWRNTIVTNALRVRKETPWIGTLSLSVEDLRLY